MRLTAFTDYGLRALMRLAAEPSRVSTTEEIAQEIDKDLSDIPDHALAAHLAG